MSHQHSRQLLFIALSIILSLVSATIFSEARRMNLVETESVNSAGQKGEFIAAFNWPVDEGRDYVWPFESMRRAPYERVWLVVETMPRIWPERGHGKRSMTLPSYRLLRVNGRSLPRPHRVTRSAEEFRIPLEKGRLRLSFVLPPGFKLDPEYAMVRVRLHKVD